MYIYNCELEKKARNKQKQFMSSDSLQISSLAAPYFAFLS